MVDDTTWKELKQHAFGVYANEGRMDVYELQKLIEIGCTYGGFDDKEKTVLISVIASLTRADVNDAMWTKVDELIHKFDLGHDSEATIESIDDEHEDEWFSSNLLT